MVTVYNPTSQPLRTFVRVPVQGRAYEVKDFAGIFETTFDFMILIKNSLNPLGKEIVTQIVPIPEQVQKIPGRVSKATNELIFEAININPLGFQSFYITEKAAGEFYPLTDEAQHDRKKRFIQSVANEVCFFFFLNMELRSFEFCHLFPVFQYKR